MCCEVFFNSLYRPGCDEQTPHPLAFSLRRSPKIKRIQFESDATPRKSQKGQPKSCYDFCSVLFCVMLGLPQDRKEPNTLRHNHGNPLAPNVLSHERANKRNILSFLGSFSFLRYDLHTVKCTFLTVQLGKFLLMYANYVTNTQIKVEDISVTPENSLVPLPSAVLSSSTTTTLTSIIICICLSLTSHMQNHTAYACLCLVLLLQQNVSESHPCLCVYQSLLSTAAQ